LSHRGPLSCCLPFSQLCRRYMLATWSTLTCPASPKKLWTTCRPPLCRPNLRRVCALSAFRQPAPGRTPRQDCTRAAMRKRHFISRCKFICRSWCPNPPLTTASACRANLLPPFLVCSDQLGTCDAGQVVDVRKECRGESREPIKCTPNICCTNGEECSNLVYNSWVVRMLFPRCSRKTTVHHTPMSTSDRKQQTVKRERSAMPRKPLQVNAHSIPIIVPRASSSI